MEETAEYTTETSSRTEIQAYVAMLHLVQQHTSNFKELAAVIGLKQPGHHLSENILGHVVKKIAQLEGKWGEEIPSINALVFDRNGMVSSWVCENVFDGTQPTLEQIAELAAAVASYDKWDKVLEAFKPRI